MVSDSKRWTEAVWEEGAEENIWTKERWSDGRKLQNEELHSLYSSPSIIRIIKLRSMSFLLDEVGGIYDMNGGEEECV
jgi:hypothetical protein